MNLDAIRSICHALPHVTEDLKWGNDLCFLIGGKMFCVAVLNEPLKVSFKVQDEEFDEMINLIGIIPAPYSARYKWVMVEDMSALSAKKWKHYVEQSYHLVKSKLPKKLLQSVQ